MISLDFSSIDVYFIYMSDDVIIFILKKITTSMDKYK